MNARAKRSYEFAIPLENFLKRKFGTLKKAAEVLGISPPLLSAYLHSKKPSERVKNTLIDLGFEADYFDKLEKITTEPDIDILTYDELKYIYIETKSIVQKQNKLIEVLDERIRELLNRKNG